MRFPQKLRCLTVLLAAVVILTQTAAAETTTATAAVTTGSSAAPTTATGETTTDVTAETTAETTVATTTARPMEPRIPSIRYMQPGVPWGKDITWYQADAPLPFEKLPWTAGRGDGKALQFDGKSYAAISLQKPTAPFTLSFWVNWQADITAEEALDQHLFTVLRNTTENAVFCTPLASRTTLTGETANGILLSGTCHLKTGWQRHEICYPAAGVISNALPMGSWHHFAVTFDAQTVAVYIDGVLWKSAALGFTFADMQADTLLIGAGINGTCRFTGCMQDFQWYTGLLTPSQICRLAQDADPFDPAVAVSPQQYVPAAVPATLITEKTYYAVTDVNGTAMAASTDVQAFWEAPQIGAGQSITGTLTVENKSKHQVQMQLETITLPEKNTAAWQYLSQLHITVMADSRLLYSGPYTGITAAALKMDYADMGYSRRVDYAVVISRSFDAQGAVVPVSVPWNFTCAIRNIPSDQPAEPRSVGLLIVLFLSAALVIASVYWAVVRRERVFFTVWNTVTVFCRDKVCRPLIARCRIWLSKLHKPRQQ